MWHPASDGKHGPEQHQPCPAAKTNAPRARNQQHFPAYTFSISLFRNTTTNPTHFNPAEEDKQKRIPVKLKVLLKKDFLHLSPQWDSLLLQSYSGKLGPFKMRLFFSLLIKAFM